MSREGAKPKPDTTTPMGGTPILVWVVYGLGILAAAIFFVSILFVLGAYLASDEDEPVTYDVSPLALVVWGGLIVAAVALWVVRRRGGRR